MPIIQPQPVNFQQLAPQPVAPGLGERLFGGLSSGLAQVLAAMQQKKENEYREQQLAQQAAQQRALEAYYQGTLGVQQGQLSAQTTEAAAKIAAQRQVGGAMGAALGMPGQTTQPVSQPMQPQPGNATQSMGPGVFQEVLGAAASQLAPGVQQIFGGVAPENIPAAVKGVQEVQALQPKPPELPTSGQEEALYTSLLATDPARAAQYKRIWLDKHPTTVVNVGPGEGKYEEETAKTAVAYLNEVVAKAKTAQSSVRVIREAHGLVDGSFTGVGAKAMLNIGRVLSAMGHKPSKDAVINTQTFSELPVTVGDGSTGP